VIVDEPPVKGSACGLAVSRSRAAAAPPTRTVSVFVAGPENAVMVAVPDRPSPMSLTMTFPLSVGASAGSIRPSDVEKVTMVPLRTGLPPPAAVVVVVAVEAACEP
jgi:hypothetical protein